VGCSLLGSVNSSVACVAGEGVDVAGLKKQFPNGFSKSQNRACLGKATSRSAAFLGSVQLKTTLAKVPSVTVYSYFSGTINTIRAGSADQAVSSVANIGDSGFSQINIASPIASNFGYFQYVADVGW